MALHCVTVTGVTVSGFFCSTMSSPSSEPRDPVGWEHPKKNSFIWDYFEENKALGLVRCSVPGCLKKYKHSDGTSTTNYSRHLKNAHLM